MSNSSKRHMGRVASLPCCVCGAEPVEVHHIMEGRTPGRRASDWLTLPVCPLHHRDNKHGIHGQRLAWKLNKTDEMKCLADTLEKIYG